MSAHGLFDPRLAGLAGFGLTSVMVGAVATQLVYFGSPVLAVTPAVLGIVVASIAWARRREITALIRW